VKVLLKAKVMNNNIILPTTGTNQNVAYAPNVPTERKIEVGCFSTNQASLQDAALATLTPRGRSVASIERKMAVTCFSTNQASRQDAAVRILVPEGRLVGSTEIKPMLSVPSERLVGRRQFELHPPAGHKKAGKFLVLVFLLATLFAACKQKPQQIAKVESKAYYTCSMHPQVHEEHPGNCPICGMKLIRVELTGVTTSTAANKIVLTASQIQLAGIQTDTVREENTGNEKTLSGTVTTDENKAEELSAGIAGRIQKLFVRTTGEKITTGQPIYSIYSEDLLESEKEYLLAKQQQKVLHNPDVDYKQLISAAENKLLLWGLSASQIRNLTISDKASPTIIILSKISGTVSDIAVHEGDYVTEGMPILKTQALNTLWVETQLYANETGLFKENDMAKVSFPDLGGQLISGKVEFINPEFADAASKVVLMRVSIPNPQGLIRPGMLAYITMSGGGQRSLAVPASAILSDGTGDKVWIRNMDGSFSMRMIKAGAGNTAYVPVLSGLSVGEVVVTNGAYLINSEYIFKNGDDKKGMGGMKM
jgi:Cu(I)/Ag(I) efflux system membrane fusion protein